MRNLAAALVLLAACGEQTAPFKQSMKLAGKEVPVETLNAGRVAYLQYCRACHGEKGDGKGPAAPGLRPPPRDFTQGSFKFGGVLDQKLPRDEDIVRIVRRGLHGTAMVGWEVPDRKLDEIIQYIKTLSPKWREDDAVGDPVQVPPDPWGEARKAEAIERGKQLYHGFAQCLGCHRPGTRSPSTSSPFPSTRSTTLPNKEADIYAIAWYVRSLMELKGTDKAEDLRRSLAAEPPFNPPPEK